MNRDFVEMLYALCDAEADFLVVGAHALAAHELPRATQDLDLWVRATPENAVRVWRALAVFGAPLQNVTVDDFATPGITLQLGLPPYRIDILTDITGVRFEEAWPNRLEVEGYGRKYAVLGKKELIRNKRAAARPKDLLDVENLERLP
jgi:hypothetical protein